MSAPLRPAPVTERLAERAAARLAGLEPSHERVSRFDPTWIALLITIIRLIVILLADQPAQEAAKICARLRAPKWWQVWAVVQRLRLLREIRARLRQARAGNPPVQGAAASNLGDPMAEPCLDAVLDESVSARLNQVEALIKEHSS